MSLANKECEHGCNSLGQYLFRGEWFPCPIHGYRQETDLRDNIMADGTKVHDYLLVPESYRGNWREDTDMYFRGVERLKYCTEESVRKLKYRMGEIYNSVAIEGKVPSESLYLYGAMIDLVEWMYMIQGVAIEKQIKTVPAITVNELAGVVAMQDYPVFEIKTQGDVRTMSTYSRLAAQGAQVFLKTGKTYLDYLNSDLCFILESGATSQGNRKMLAGFVEERAHNGRGTYVISTVHGSNRHPAVEEGCRNLSRLDVCQLERKAGFGDEKNIVNKPEGNAPFESVVDTKTVTKGANYYGLL